jgi:hypothetical protein
MERRAGEGEQAKSGLQKCAHVDDPFLQVRRTVSRRVWAVTC